MYRINVYSKGMDALTSLFAPANIYQLSYITELNKAGSATFKIKTLDAKATATNLQLYNRIKIYKGTEVEFFGFIEELQVDINEIEVRCRGMLALFEKRIRSLVINGTYHPTAGEAAMRLLEEANSIDDTGIAEGIDDTSRVLSNIELTFTPIFTSWQKIAQLASTDFEIDTDGNFNIRDIGTDRTADIIFRYIQGQINTSTIYELDIEVSGKDMANSIRGKGTSWSVQATAEDATSISQFGQLDQFFSQPQTGSGGSLDDEVDAELANNKQEFYTPRVRPNIEKIDVDSFDVGDTVSVKIINGFISIDTDHRIIKKAVTVSDNLTAVVEVSLIPEGVNKLPSSFFDDIIDLKKQVQLIQETS